MKTMQSFAQMSLALVGSLLIAGPVSATGVRDHHDRGYFDFSSLKKNKGQVKSKIADAIANSDWLEDLQGPNKSDAGDNRYSALKIIGKFDDYSQGKKPRHQDPLKFLFGGSGRNKHEGHLKMLSERHPHYANYLTGFGDSERDLRLLGKKIIADDGSNGASVVPIPPAAWLMLSGLAVLGWRARKSGHLKAHQQETPAPA